MIGNPIGSELRVNTYTTNNQSYPFVSSNGTNYVVVWESWGQDNADGRGIYGQLYDNDGSPMGTEFQIIHHITNCTRNASVSSNGTNYLVTWYNDDMQDDAKEGIYGQFYSSDGSPIGSEFQINTYTIDDQRFSSVSSNGSDYLVTWESWGQDGSYDGIFGKSISGYTGYDTDPLNSDSDNDAMPDGWEVDNSLNPTVNDTEDDIDNDGLTNIEEFYHETAPNNPDTDNDGMEDGDEIRLFMEPDNADSLFRITYCGFEASSSGITLEWQGSASNPDLPYKIFWCDDPGNPWNEAIVESGDIFDNDGIRTWIDDGDNDSTVPRPAPDNAVFRLYKVVAE
ncbi:MAG: hypothetical protein C4541_05995 [Candidatus Auribacter fodinae]|jgi:hypothetical protein|uniref:Uncharacterized protein n=1 Tax=Candidatus Auribacter fodinae TaxID=2093366 RepID=A0A3A4R047_9BACT|nr:MAG: hypothetical protein C4541_05995 [Candidatus Auribacter fodinae]